MISILMTPYQRDKQMAVTLESIQRQGKDVEIVIVPDDRPRLVGGWLNPAPLLNQAINRSKGNILIIQNAECSHWNDVIENLSKVPKGEAWFASCMALKEYNREDKWYCHPTLSRRPLFFCGAIHREDMVPYDEEYTGYGYEDVQLADDLSAKGIAFYWLDPEEALVHHQWHPRFYGNSNMRDLYERKKNAH